MSNNNSPVFEHTVGSHSDDRGGDADLRCTCQDDKVNNNSGKVEELKEKLAAIEHERWADWQKWCHEVLRRELPLDFSPRLDKVLERWDKQIETPYSELSDKEKASDMEQVDRYWHLIEAYIASQVNEARIDELKELPAYKYGSWQAMTNEWIDARIKELQSKKIKE